MKISKWQLLRSALLGKRDYSNTASIHSFRGFADLTEIQLLGKKEVEQFSIQRDHNIVVNSTGSDHSIKLYTQKLEPFSKFDSSLTDIIINDCLQLLYLDDVICSISIDLSSYNSDKSGFNSTLERIRLWTESVQFSSSDRVDIRLQKYVEPTTYISGVVELFVTLKLNECHLSNASDFKYFQYALPTFTLNNNIDGEYINSLSNGIEKMIHIYTREKRKDCGVTAKTLVSNSNPLTPNPLIKGVDNTGNICVWPAEGALLCALLRCERYRNLLQGARVLELGGGQAGLAGLGVAAAGLSQEVVISDGNGQCVANQGVCIELSRHLGSLKTPVTSKLIHWATASAGSSSGGGGSCADEKKNEEEEELGLFDLVLAADCLFFRDFHEALLQLLPRLLRPPPPPSQGEENEQGEGERGGGGGGGGGSVLLLQPRRGDSMEEFLQKMAQRGDLQLVATDLDYCPEISEQRQQLSEMEGYNEDIHLPVLLHLQLKKK